MNVALQHPWTVERFLDWADRQDGRYEFDGVRPIGMTGGNARHSRVTTNIHAALRARLRGTSCSYYGPDLGILTVGQTVRFPDALVTCTRFADSERLAPDPTIVFEVVSPSSGRTDRIEKLREYAAVPSIRCYVIVETRFAGLLVLRRAAAKEAWTAEALAAEDTLHLPDFGTGIPVSELYEDVDLTDATDGQQT